MRLWKVDKRPTGLCVASGMAVWLLVFAGGCLQQEDLSADLLTSFVEPTQNGDASASNNGDHSSKVHEDKVHEEMPPGANANAAISAKTGSEAGQGAASGSSDVPGEGTEMAGAGLDAGSEPVEGVPEFREHREMPPGYGSNLPPEGRPESVPLPEGAGVPAPSTGVGEPEQVQPQVLTPFERECEGKPCITVTGMIKVEGTASAGVDLDCFVPDTSTRAGRKLVNKVKLGGPGAYAMKVPANIGKLSLVAFMDVENDGPDSSDPQGRYTENPLEIKDKDIENIDIELTSPESATQ